MAASLIVLCPTVAAMAASAAQPKHQLVGAVTFVSGSGVKVAEKNVGPGREVESGINVARAAAVCGRRGPNDGERLGSVQGADRKKARLLQDESEGRLGGR